MKDDMVDFFLTLLSNENYSFYSTDAILDPPQFSLDNTFKGSLTRDFELQVFFYKSVTTANQQYNCLANTEAEFLDEIPTKVLRVFLLAIHSLSTNGFYSPTPLEQRLFGNWFVM
jgi:hypothetical protein